MAVAVFPRLGELLRARNLTLADLEWQIEQRFGVPISPGSLDRLIDAEPVRQADLEAVGAAAEILGVGLDALFDVVAVPTDNAAEISFLEPEQSRRLAELLDRQSYVELTVAEQRELQALVTEYGRRMREHLLEEVARRRGVSIEQARRDSDAAIARALESYRALQADLRRRRSAIQPKVAG